jgi:hypothetical protein
MTNHPREADALVVFGIAGDLALLGRNARSST